MDRNHDYSALVRRKRELEAEKETKYLDSSRERLKVILEKKIKTTMVGDLSTLEKYFGFLWGHNEDRPLNEEELHMKELFERARKEILDRGNSQIKNMQTEVDQYDVKWNRYQLTLPVKPEGPNNG